MSIKHIPIYNSQIFVNKPQFSEINHNQLILIGGVTTVGFTAMNSYLNQNYWKGKSEYSVSGDFNKYHFMDKLGYFYLANLMTHVFSAGLESCGMEFEDTYIYGSIGACLLGTYLEIRDEYSKGRAFNTSDFAFTFLGSTYALSQYYFPILKEVQPRISYQPSAYFKDRMSSGENSTFMTDLLGQKYWLSFRLKNLLPKNISEYWPSFLMISLGKGISGENYSNLRSDVYLALDIDAESIPLYGPVWQFVKNTLNYFHFPLPGIRLTNGIAAFAFCF